MAETIQKLITTYRSKGLTGIFERIFRYMTNWRVRREDIIWFLTRIHIGYPKPITKVHDLKYCLHSHDPGISRELAVYHIHEPNATDLFRKYIKEGMFEVDIGSNLGYYALLAATLVGTRGKVLAIEPEPRNYKLLTLNKTINHIQNIDTFQCAIGDKDGTDKFYLTKASNTNSLIPPSAEFLLSSTMVQVRKLDSLLKELNFPKVDFIRMDIEGGEVTAIEGMQQTLQQYKPIILVELHCDAAGINAIVKLLRALKSFGYNPEYVVDRDQDFVWKKKRCFLHLTSMDELLNLIVNYRVATVLLR
jgi:FkbM family methyltransferase